MKTRLIIIALLAITLLSFTAITSTKKVSNDNAEKKSSAQSGFALEDSNQF